MRTVIALALLTACGGSSMGSGSEPGDAGAQASDAAAPGARFSQIYAELFPATTAPRCNFCHSMPASDTSNGKLSVGTSQDVAYAMLVGKDSSSSRCNGMPLVTPGDPEASLFYLKLMDPSPCGARMPLGGSALSASQLEQVRSWIAAGAKND
jgi:hypothetical protein